MIDADQVITSINYPEALREALIHRRNTMVGNIQLENHKEYQCLCCNKKTRKSQPINFSIHDIGFLGAGYTLYFMFNRMCLLILVILGILKQINSFIYSNLFKKYEVQIIQEHQLLSLWVVLSIAGIIYEFDKKMVRTGIQLDETHVDPQDYSVSILNIPIQFSQNNQLDNVLRQYFLTEYSQKIVIASVCLCYNLVPLGRFLSRRKQQLNIIKRYQDQKQKRLKIVNVLFNANDIPYQGVSEYHGIKKIDKLNGIKMANCQQYSKQKLASIEKLISQTYHNSNIMFIGQAFVSFETVQMKNIVLKQSQNAYFYGNKLKIQQVTNPRDINWHNLHLQKQDYKLRRIFSVVSCMALIFTALSIRLFFAWIQLKTEDTRFQSPLLKSSTSGIIILMNIIIQDFFLKHLSHHEGHHTKVKNLTVYASKCIALQILTCLIVPYLAAYLIFQMKQQQTYLQKMDDLIFGNAMVSLILISISHKTLIKSLKIKLFQFGGWRFIPKNILTVRQLCSYYQLPQFQIQKRYSQTVKNTFLTVCFFSMVPKALYYTILHLFFVYYIDKYNLVRRRCVLVSINTKMNKGMMKILMLCPIIYILASMIEYKQVSWIMLMILSLSIASLFKFFNKKVIQKKIDVASSMTFWQANAKYFHTDYRRQNPALAGIAQVQFEQKINQLNLEMNITQASIQK